MRGWVNKVVKAYLNKKSFKTNQKIIVIESDDWGSLRTRDKATRDRLNAINPEISKDVYIQKDSIASENDLDALFEVLSLVKDRNNNPACLTANVCTANPDFRAIKADDFQKFYFKDFTQTLEEYSHKQRLLDLWKAGEQSNLFKPQLHGREHLHALAWLAELRAGNTDLLKAFELESFGIPYQAKLRKKRKNLQAALDVYGFEGELNHQKQWIADSTSIFKNTFGYHAKSFIAPAYTWHKDLHKTLFNHHIEGLQGIQLQYQPKPHKNNYHKKPHYTGKTDQTSGLVYTVRNAFFEPFLNPDKDWIEACQKDIETAFSKHTPAIIGSHRVNFIGRLDVKHRDDNLKQFKTLLKTIIKKYPDVIFMSSADLVDTIKSKKFE